MTDDTKKPTITSSTLTARGSIKLAAIKAIPKGKTAIMEVYGTPTFFPHALHVAGTAGPRNNLRTFDIPGSPQCGHSYIFLLPVLASNLRL